MSEKLSHGVNENTDLWEQETWGEPTLDEVNKKVIRLLETISTEPWHTEMLNSGEVMPEEAYWEWVVAKRM